MPFRLFYAWLALLCLFTSGRGEQAVYPWVYLVPENDSRDAEVADFDEYLSRCMVDDMNNTEQVFQHHLAWAKLPISRLLSAQTPFCELNFDAVKPLILTPKEKSIVREYLSRGGFILLSEDAYPYSQDEFWAVKEWPITQLHDEGAAGARSRFHF